jgi:DNA-binding LacI/PurR family transcriptional regulator
MRKRLRMEKGQVQILATTTKDIAVELGVSQSTVSRILNGVASFRVSDETRTRVLEAAHRLDYRPNALARSLRSGRTHLIGFHDTWASDTFNAEHEFLARIIGGLQSAAARRDCDVLLHMPMQGRSPAEVFARLTDGRVDGLILHGDTMDPLVQRLVQSKVPLVTIVDKVEGVPGVSVDDWDGARQAAQYLWARGYRRFAFLAPEQDGGGPTQRGYDWRGMLFERGIEEIPIVRMDHDEGVPPLDELLEWQGMRPDEPVAVFCWNDRAAYNLLRACLERGVRVPQQLAVVGFDGFVDLKLPALQLTTVSCLWGEVAAAAVNLLLRRIGGEDVPLETLLPVDLIAGNTA